MGFKTYNQTHNQISESPGDTEFHKYSDNTLEELELLLKHHIEDLEEYSSQEVPKASIDDAKKDIKEIKKAIEVKKLDEGKVEILQAVTALNKQIEKLIKKSSEPRDLHDEKAFWAVIDNLRVQREKLYKVNF